MKRNELKLRHGGLYRCCVDSFTMWVQALPDEEARPGEQIVCVHENKATMVVDDTGRFVEWWNVEKHP